MINIDKRPPTDVLMEALASVEGCTHVVIVIEKADEMQIKANCDYKDIAWILDQGKYLTLKELFDVPSE